MNDQKSDEREVRELRMRHPTATWALKRDVPRIQSLGLCVEKLEQIGYSKIYAECLYGASVTAIELAAATIAQEHRGMGSSINSDGGIAVEIASIVVVNRTLDGLENIPKLLDQNKLYQVIAKRGQFHALTSATKHNRSRIARLMLCGELDILYDISRDKLKSYNHYPIDGFRQVWRNNSFVVNVGKRLFWARKKAREDDLHYGGHYFSYECAK